MSDDKVWGYEVNQLSMITFLVYILAIFTFGELKSTGTGFQVETEWVSGMESEPQICWEGNMRIRAFGKKVIRRDMLGLDKEEYVT